MLLTILDRMAKQVFLFLFNPSIDKRQFLLFAVIGFDAIANDAARQIKTSRKVRIALEKGALIRLEQAEPDVFNGSYGIL